MCVAEYLLERGEFVSHHSITHIQEQPQVIFCSLQFDFNQYKDEFYRQFRITLPNSVQKAVKKRRAEYLAGRIACKLCLQKLGIISEVLISDPPNRFPVWPAGVNGSISHCGNRAVALVNSSSLSTGVDVESVSEESVAVLKSAINEVVPELLDTSTTMSKSSLLGIDSKLVLAFSAKECLYKALYNHVGYMFGFESAQLIESTENSFKLQLTCNLNAFLVQGRVFEGRYFIEDDLVITYILLNI